MKDCYTVTDYSVSQLLGRIDHGDIAIPEIQRPFVWDSTKVRDLIDSLYHGYPTGYLITWKNPDVKLKGGGTAEGKVVLIDGQQRVTALTCALSGVAVLNEDYERRRITISFDPLYEGEDTPFAVLTPVIAKDPRWISDIAEVFRPGTTLMKLARDYIKANPGCDEDAVYARFEDLKNIENRRLGCIEVDADCTIDEVTEIFIRINSKGAVLSQADFAMSKIAADEVHGGNMLRRAIDYYCHLAVKPEFWAIVSVQDADYMASEYAPLAEWLKDDRDDIYDPDYNDVLRVAFMAEFGRGKLADLVALLSGRDFEARDYKSEIADESFARLHDGVVRFMRRSNFQDFVMALRSAGFISPNLLNSTGAVNFAYNLYLTLQRDPAVPSVEVKAWVQRWYVLSTLTGRYSGSAESNMDRDIRAIRERGFAAFYADAEAAQLSDNFWEVNLPQLLTTTSTRTGAWLVYLAAQVKDADNTLFTTGVKVSDTVATTGDIHHVFPKAYLRAHGLPRRLYNQVANYTFLERKINIAVKDDAPGEYFTRELSAVRAGRGHYGNIQSEEGLRANLVANCIPEDVFDMGIDDYERFLAERRRLMAVKIRDYFFGL